MLVFSFASHFSGGHLPAGYTKCDLKAYGDRPSFRVSNERAWTNPTPTPWGRDSEYSVPISHQLISKNVSQGGETIIFKKKTAIFLPHKMNF